MSPHDSLAASGTATIEGTIIDAVTKHPIPAVVVTVTSPSLQGEQSTATDAGGDYSIPDLPPGAYTLRADADGYRPYARGGTELHVDVTTRVSAELLPDAPVSR